MTTFTPSQQSLALAFAHHLADGHYDAAYQLLSPSCQSGLSLDDLQKEFQAMIPADWGAINPIELEEGLDWDFIYVVLGGDVYSEAIFIHRFEATDNLLLIAEFSLGRP